MLRVMKTMRERRSGPLQPGSVAGQPGGAGAGGGVGDGGTTGSITGDVANDGMLVFDRSNRLDVAGVISAISLVLGEGPTPDPSRKREGRLVEATFRAHLMDSDRDLLPEGAGTVFETSGVIGSAERAFALAERCAQDDRGRRACAV